MVILDTKTLTCGQVSGTKCAMREMEMPYKKEGRSR